MRASRSRPWPGPARSSTWRRQTAKRMTLWTKTRVSAYSHVLVPRKELLLLLLMVMIKNYGDDSNKHIIMTMTVSLHIGMKSTCGRVWSCGCCSQRALANVPSFHSTTPCYWTEWSLCCCCRSWLRPGHLLQGGRHLPDEWLRWSVSLCRAHHTSG